jgi:Spy/CpxP family protein refolding chaperone
MQRPKQQALMFLLGAVLVGGVLGFSAERMMGHQRFAERWGSRAKFYDDLGLTQPQRTTMDSLIEEQHCRIEQLLKPVKPQLDSIKASFKAQQNRVLTPEQLARLESRLKEREARQDPRRTNQQVKQCTKS